MKKGLPVDDNKPSHVGGSIQQWITSCHDEAHNALCSHSECQSQPRSYPVAHERAQDCAGDIEESNDRVPAKILPQRRALTEDDLQPSGGVDAEGVGGKVVDEPDERHHR